MSGRPCFRYLPSDIFGAAKIGSSQSPIKLKTTITFCVRLIITFPNVSASQVFRGYPHSVNFFLFFILLF